MLRRGFKAEAERRAATIRREMGLRPDAAVRPIEVARHLNAEYRLADELVPRESLEELERLQPYAFSGCTFEIGSRTIVVVNPLHSLARQNSDGMHELSHLLLRHEVQRLERVGDFVFFTCDPDQEEEANVLAGTLLLPRPLLLQAHAAGRGATDIAREFDVTEPMARWRLNASGVAAQVRRRAS